MLRLVRAVAGLAEALAEIRGRATASTKRTPAGPPP
jgi:hypothetical protein